MPINNFSSRFKKEFNSWKVLFNQAKDANHHFQKAQADLKREIPKAEETIVDLQHKLDLYQEKNSFKINRMKKTAEKINRKLK